MFRRFRKTALLLVGMAAAGVPLVTTASCDPYTQAFEFFRDDGSHNSNLGFLDFFFDDGYYYSDDYYSDEYYSDCCYDDYWF